MTMDTTDPAGTSPVQPEPLTAQSLADLLGTVIARVRDGETTAEAGRACSTIAKEALAAVLVAEEHETRLACREGETMPTPAGPTPAPEPDAWEAQVG